MPTPDEGSASPGPDASAKPARDERRHNPLLRMLIDEMLEQVRELHRHAVAEERDDQP